MNSFDQILLEPVQKELLTTLVEAARNTPRDNRQKFFVLQSSGGDELLHSYVPKDKTQIYFGDVEVLSNEGLLALGYGSGGTPNFDITPLGFQYCEYLKKKSGEPVERIEATMKDFLDAQNFVKRYPEAYKKWSLAEDLLWKTDSQQQLTTIGHLCREAVQEFAGYLVYSHNPPNVTNDKSKTVARLKAIIDLKVKDLSDTKKGLFDAMIAYWGTVNDLIQRQEHDSQKEGQPLIWEDARVVVFQTLIIMFEIDRIL